MPSRSPSIVFCCLICTYLTTGPSWVPPAAGKPNKARSPRASASSAWRLAVLPKNSKSEPSVIAVRIDSVLLSCSARTGTSTRSNRSSGTGLLTAGTDSAFRSPDSASCKISP